MKTIISKITSLPLVSYVKRYWIILAVLAVLIIAYTTDALALTMRGALVIPIFMLTAVASGLLLRNIYNRATTDRYCDNKEWLRTDWDNLSPWQRILIMKIESLIYFLGGCLIAAGLVIVIQF